MSAIVAISPSIASLIEDFASFKIVLDKFLLAAGAEASSGIVTAAQGAMDWKNPTGALSDSIQAHEVNPHYFQVGSDLPYARRRNWGFSGQTDSRGRYYANDPGKQFMESALSSTQSANSDIYTAAVYAALEELAAISKV